MRKELWKLEQAGLTERALEKMWQGNALRLFRDCL